MKKLFFFISLLIISSGSILSQTSISANLKISGITWQKTIGSDRNEYAVNIINTLDSGFALLGNAITPGSADYLDLCIVKLDKNGTFKWGKKIDGIDNDKGYSLIQTSDSCYILAGATNGTALDYFDDMFMVKLDPDGGLLWAKTFGTDGWDKALKIKNTTDNGFIVIGYSEINAQDYGLLIVKFSENGYVEWSRFAEKTGLGLIFPDIILTNDNGYGIATTIIDVLGSNDMCFLKLDDFGRHQFSWIIGGTNEEEGVSACQTSDNGYIITGYTNTFGAGYPDLYIVKISVGGSLLWTRTIGGISDDYGFSVMKSNDGGFIIGGEGFSYGNGDLDFYIVKLDSNGRYISGNTFGSTERDYFRSMVHDYDGGFLTVGSTGPGDNGEIYLVKTDSAGRTCGSSIMPNPHIDSGGSILKYPVNVYPWPTTLVNINVSIVNWGRMTDLCLTGNDNYSGKIPEKFSLSQNYPNPFNPVTKISFDIPNLVGNGRDRSVKLIIYDLLGREITALVNDQLQPGSYTIDWDASGYASGVYFYSLVTDEFTETKRMVLIK